MPRNRAEMPAKAPRIAGAAPEAVSPAGAGNSAVRGQEAAPRGKLTRGPEWLESEKDFTGYVKGLAKAFGWQRYHTLFSKGSDAGFPDLVLLRGPRLVVAELKTMKGKVTPAQNEWLLGFRAVPNAEVYLWRPCDRDEIERILR